MFAKRKRIFLFFLLLFSSLSPLLFGEEMKLTLKECVALALKNSKRVAASKADVSIALASKNETRALLLPHLVLEGKYEEKNTARDFSVFTEYGGAFSTQTIGLQIRCLLFDFGGAYNQLRAEKKALVASEKMYERTQQNIEEEAKVNYFRILQVAQMKRVLEESIKILTDQQKITSDFFHQGIASKSDLLFVEVDLGEKKKNYLRAENEYFHALMDLNRLLGRDLLEPLSLEDLQEIPKIDFSLESLRQMAMKNRLDLKAMNQEILSLLARKRAAKAGYAPRLFAFGGYSYLRESTSNQNNWISGGVGLEFSLYDGGKTSASVDKIRGKIDETEAHKENLENQILLETNNLYLQFQEGLEMLKIDNASVELAKENLRMTSDRYKQGLVSIRDLLAAEKQLTTNRLGQIHTIYHAQILLAKLLNAIGE
jgi:outer membrane protein